MNVEATDQGFVSLADRVRDALVANGRLTPEGVVRIIENMRATGNAFGDAALHLGLITQSDLAEAAETARQMPPKGDGVIEGALLKLSGARGLPVKYTGMCKAGPALILAHHPDSPYSERMRALRTELLLLNGNARTGNLIALLSPCQGEGRSQLCAELAIACSQLGLRTLLVDANLRRPRMHKLFEAENLFGLGQALSVGATPQMLGVEKLPHLSVLTSGPSISNPLEVLSQRHFQRHITDWRKKYEMIIIDTPAISEYADGLAIASFTQQVVIVSRAGHTPHKSMKEMLRRLAATQSRIVGAIINRF